MQAAHVCVYIYVYIYMYICVYNIYIVLSMAEMGRLPESICRRDSASPERPFKLVRWDRMVMSPSPFPSFHLCVHLVM